jgi:hypothetical protein
MAHFAEIDENNKVIRVLVGCNNDIAANGGEQSEEAANHFASVVGHSFNGVKYIQTSYNNNFRQRFAGVGMIYDVTNNVFVEEQPFASWTLDENYEWQPLVARPLETDTIKNTSWDEENQRWLASDVNGTSYYWDSNTLEFVQI